MGIAGLLIALNDVAEDVHVSDYAGKVAGVDVFGWLHRGITASFELDPAYRDRPAAAKPVAFVLEMVEMLLQHGVTPYLVFDGSHLPAKAATDAARRAERAKALERARAILAVDSADTTGASLLRKATSVVTDEMVHLLLRALRQRQLDPGTEKCSGGVRFLVAPFEADAQLAFMARRGVVDVVISEDSDLLVFGAPVLLTKLDKAGSGKQLRLRSLGAAAQLCFLNWKQEAFVECCVLAGCDYVHSLRGVGLMTAHKVLREHRSAEALFEAVRQQQRREQQAGSARCRDSSKRARIDVSGDGGGGAEAAAAAADRAAAAGTEAAKRGETGRAAVKVSGLGPAARAGFGPSYEAAFWRAVALFRYHYVWDEEAVVDIDGREERGCITTLNPLPPRFEETQLPRMFIGGGSGSGDGSVTGGCRSCDDGTAGGQRQCLGDVLGEVPSADLMRLVAAGKLHPDKLVPYEDLAQQRAATAKEHDRLTE